MTATIRTAILAATAMLATSNALSAELSFNNIELGYERLDDDVDGFGIAASGELNETFYIGGSYQRVDAFGFDFNAYEAYLGVRRNLSDTSAVYGTVGLARVSSDFGSSDTEAAVSVGLRGMLTPSFELDGNLSYVNADGAELGAELTGTFFFNDSLGLYLSGFGNSDDTGAGAGLRINF